MVPNVGGAAPQGAGGRVSPLDRLEEAGKATKATNWSHAITSTQRPNKLTTTGQQVGERRAAAEECGQKQRTEDTWFRDIPNRSGILHTNGCSWLNSVVSIGQSQMQLSCNTLKGWRTPSPEHYPPHVHHYSAQTATSLLQHLGGGDYITFCLTGSNENRQVQQCLTCKSGNQRRP